MARAAKMLGILWGMVSWYRCYTTEGWSCWVYVHVKLGLTQCVRHHQILDPARHCAGGAER